MRAITDLLNEYGESHRNETNKFIHWICVPAIFFSIVGLLYSVKLPFYVAGHHVNLAMIVMLLVLIYYFILSPALAVGMFLFGGICMLGAHFIETTGILPLWKFCLIVFIVAWIGQFYGHKVEGKKPSFLKDLQFLMIGPAWLMSFIYKRMGISI